MRVIKYHTGGEYRVAVELRTGHKYAHLLQSEPGGLRVIKTKLANYNPVQVFHQGKSYPLERAYRILKAVALSRGYYGKSEKASAALESLKG